MQSWQLHEIELGGGTRSPVVLHSTNEARAVLIGLDPGQRLGDHQVKELAWLTVIDGKVVVESGGRSLEAEAGTLLRFEADERRSVSSEGGAKILLLLAPWPGEGHYRGDRPTPSK
jgi:quercetin dioxygenase-like cupin family protein